MGVLGQPGATCSLVGVPQAGVHTSGCLWAHCSHLHIALALERVAGKWGWGLCPCGLHSLPPLSLVSPSLWPTGWREPPAPPSATQGWKVSEGRAEGPYGWACSQGALGLGWKIRAPK